MNKSAEINAVGAPVAGAVECGKIVLFGAEETSQENTSPGWEGLNEPLPQPIDRA